MIGPAPRTDVYKALDSERAYQEVRWSADAAPGRTEADHVHTLSEWALYIQDYTNEMVHILSRTASPAAEEKAIHWIRKIGAMCVCCMEQNGAPQREGYETR